MDTHELAWAAGFFDGEGYAKFGSDKRNVHQGGRLVYTTLRIDVRQTDRRVLDRFRAIVGVGKVYGPYSPATTSRQPVFAFVCSNFEGCQHITAQLWLWLSPIKRGQLKQALIGWRSFTRYKPGCKPDSLRDSHGRIVNGWNRRRIGI